MTANGTADVVVVGGGVMGCSTAWFLAAEHGIRSVIVERDAVASGASGGAAGELGAVGRHRYSIEYTRFLLDAIRMHTEIAETLVAESGVDYLFSDIPILRPALDEEEARDLQAQMGWQREIGIDVEWLDETQVRSLGTWLTEEALGAAYTTEKQLEAYPFAIALAQACEKRGVSIRTAEVNGVLRDGDHASGVTLASGERIEAGAVLVANGPWSQHTSEWLGMEVPVVPLRGQIVHLAPPNGVPMPTHSIFHETGYVLPKAGGDLLVGTTEELVGFDPYPTMEAQNSILEAVIRIAPNVLDAPIRDLTACLRPYSPDQMPILGPVPGTGSLYLSTGHGYKGITLAIISGKAMAQQIANGRSDIDIAPFSPTRFAEAS
ncbi:MAG: FAD-dependent oxidoreductase [Chloroflexi bacterium]|nr:FAD-dependent oxidoreductase [Chloroflexota bacterium]MYK35154.1 FAD-dependent oxidoreductase [Chloroflexota bacterium]